MCIFFVYRLYNNVGKESGVFIYYGWIIYGLFL